MLPASAVLLSDRAAQALVELEGSNKPEAGAIARRARALRPVLLVDCLHGEVVRKSAIPPPLHERYGLENLYVEDLPSFWRLLYTIVKKDGLRVIVVVEIVEHRVYSRWFRGKR